MVRSPNRRFLLLLLPCFVLVFSGAAAAHVDLRAAPLENTTRFISLALKGDGKGTYLLTNEWPGSDWGVGGRDEGTILYKWATSKPLEFKIPEPAKSFDVANDLKNGQAQIVGTWHVKDRGTYYFTPFDCSVDVDEAPTSVSAHLSRSGGGSVTLTLKPTNPYPNPTPFFLDSHLPDDACPDGKYVGPDPASLFTVTQAQYNVYKGEFDPIVFKLPASIVDGPFKEKDGGFRGQHGRFAFPDEHVNKSALELTYSVDNTGQSEASSCAYRKRTGKGFDGLSAEMKARLARLFDLLTQQNACFYFIVGFRATKEQAKLYEDWHAIADDRGPNDNRSYDEVSKELAATHQFAQKHPDKDKAGNWRNPDGTAKGGPAVPGTSRHEVNEASDINVIYPPNWARDLGKFATAAKTAGLCPPWNADPVHVELPFKGRKDPKPKCHH